MKRRFWDRIKDFIGDSFAIVVILATTITSLMILIAQMLMEIF